jgi:Ca2+-binding RTX toxin-like protein
MPAIVSFDYVTNTPDLDVFDDQLLVANDASSATLANGNFISVYNDGDGVVMEAHVFTAGGKEVANETVINLANATFDQFRSFDTDVAALKNGNAIVTYTDASGPTSVIRGQFLDATGKPVGDGFVVNPGLADTSSSKVAVLADGGFVVTYQNRFKGSATDNDIHSTVYNANGSVRVADINVAGSFANDQEPDVVALAKGGFVATWTRVGANGAGDTLMKVFDANGVAKSGELSIDGGTGNSRDMTATALADGGFAVAYTDNAFGSGTDDIGVKIFNADGTSRSGFILANAGDTSGTQSQAAITQLSNGFIMVSWTDVASQTSRFTVLDSAGKVILTPQDLFSAFENITETTLTALAGGQIAALGTGHDQDGSTSISGQVGSVIRQTIGDGTSETLAGDDLTDIMVGNGGNDTLKGFGGNDNLNGGIGNDKLDGGKGIDKMIGGTGDDTYIVDNAADKTVEADNGGTDTVLASVSYVLSNFDKVENLSTTNAASTASINLFGNFLDNVVTGNAGNNQLEGGFGNDTLKGGAGADNLIGDAGNDTLFVDNAGDTINESVGQGEDTVASSVTYVLTASAEVETLRTTSNAGTAAIDLTGNEFAQTVLGNAGANTLRGLGGNDFVQGLAGNDKLLGGDGDDKMSGGLGFDKMGGGAGKDVFLFAALDESGIGAAKADQITDFAAGDKIDISKIDAIAGGSDNAFKLDAGGAFVAGEIHQTFSGGNLVLDFNVDGDAAAEMSIVLIGQTTLLAAGDFIL